MLHQLITGLETITTDLITTLGHWGIFIAMVIESACIPLPSEVVMLFGGFLVAQGILNFWLVVTAGVLGNLVGSVLAYWIGKSGGRHFLKKYGKFILFNYQHLEKAEQWYQKYGSWATFFGRNLPFIRTFISLPAGITKMDFKKFFIFTFFGCIPWNVALTYIGLKLGQNWQVAEPYIKPLSYVVLIVIVILILRFVYKNLAKRRVQ